MFIHFGATEKDLQYLGLWDCNPFLHRHTNVDQLDSGIAVHSTDKHQLARVSDDPGRPVLQQQIPNKSNCKFVYNSTHGTNAETMAQKPLQEHTT